MFVTRKAGAAICIVGTHVCVSAGISLLGNSRWWGLERRMVVGPECGVPGVGLLYVMSIWLGPEMPPWAAPLPPTRVGDR